MGEISINPKFNIHEKYKKVRILNPYRNGYTGIYSSALHIYAFRKLIPSSTRCIRARRLSDSLVRDIGWDGDYLDETSLINFSNGGSVTYEMYNQVTDTLGARLSNQDPIFDLPLIVSSGVINKRGGFVSGFLDYGKNLKVDFTSELPSNCSTYMVLETNNITSGFMATISSSEGGYDVMEAGSTSQAIESSISPQRKLNTVDIYPTTRGEYYNLVNPKGLCLLELTGVDYSGFTAPSDRNDFDGCNWSYRFVSDDTRETIPYRTEFIIMDDNVPYNKNAVSADIMAYYNL